MKFMCLGHQSLPLGELFPSSCFPPLNSYPPRSFHITVYQSLFSSGVYRLKACSYLQRLRYQGNCSVYFCLASCSHSLCSRSIFWVDQIANAVQLRIFGKKKKTRSTTALPPPSALVGKFVLLPYPANCSPGQQVKPVHTGSECSSLGVYSPGRVRAHPTLS